jgi:hypothetical protein
MPDALQQAQPEADAPRSRRWTRTHTVWLLLVLSFLPGVVIALFREHWLELPAGVRGASHLTSAILIAAACALILATGKQNRRSKPESPAGSNDS